jgi:hypothetical protein
MGQTVERFVRDSTHFHHQEKQMKQLTLHQFLVGLGWTESMKNKLTEFSDREDVNYLVAFNTGNKLSASAFREPPEDGWPAHAVAYWTKVKDKPKVSAKSKTMEALALVDQGMTRYAAAKQIGISESAVHRAWHRRQGKTICPACNQIIP